VLKLELALETNRNRVGIRDKRPTLRRETQKAFWLRHPHYRGQALDHRWRNVTCHLTPSVRLAALRPALSQRFALIGESYSVKGGYLAAALT